MSALFFRTYLFALRGLSLVAGRGYSLVVMCGFSSQWLSCCGALVLGVQGFSCCSVARGIFPHQGLNLCPLPWQGDS